MPIVRVDAKRITDWASFHIVFAEAFGFPDFYGRNMDAWIDCMSSIGKDDGMTAVHGSQSDPVVLVIESADSFPAEQFQVLIECAGIVNLRNLEVQEPAILILAFHRK
jgi:RNAse (barnase) inhibitor barstar